MMGESEFTYGPFVISKNKEGLWVLNKFLPSECECSYCDKHCLFSDIPSFIQVIGPYAFTKEHSNNCRGITHLIIPNGVQIIEQHAFSDYGSLEIVSLPETLKRIEDSAFSYCNIKSLYIPDSVEYIGENAFIHNKHLSKLSLPNNIEIGAYAFGYCGMYADICDVKFKVRPTECDSNKNYNYIRRDATSFDWSIFRMRAYV